MRLTEREREKLLITVAGDLARRRMARGLLLNHPESVALITSELLEGARDGLGVAELMAAGRKVLTRDQVMPGVPEMIGEVQVEATFVDGTKLVTVHEPIGGAAPGAYRLAHQAGPIELNAGRDRATVEVTNTGDRPIQVGSHFCFFEVNRALTFNRARARGMRLDIPAGTAVRFEPGEARPVDLVALGGERLVLGHNGFSSDPAAFAAGDDAGAST